MKLIRFALPLLLMILPVRAATPEEVTLHPGGSVSWTGATVTAVNHHGACNPPAEPCDVFRINVEVSPGFWQKHDGGLLISIDGFHAPNDFDLTAQQEFGTGDEFGPHTFANPQPAGLPEAIFIPFASGRVTVRVIPREVLDSGYLGRARLSVWPKKPPSVRTSAPLRPSFVGVSGFDPSIVLNPSAPMHVVAAFIGVRDGVSVATSEDGGRTWRTTGTLGGYGDTATGFASALSVSLRYADDRLYAIVHRRSEDGDRIMLHVSTDGAKTWSDQTQVAFVPHPHPILPVDLPTGDALFLESKVEPSDLGTPRLAAYGKTLVACWSQTINSWPGYADLETPLTGTFFPSDTDQDPLSFIASSRSSDGGATWAPATPVSGPTRLSARLPAGEFADACDITGDEQGGFHVAWYDQTSSAVRIAGVPSGSTTFGVPVTVAALARPGALNGAGLAPTPEPKLASSKGSLGVLWHEQGVMSNDVFFCRSTDGGATWSAKVHIGGRRAADRILPALTGGPNGSYDATFFDRRNDASNYFFDTYFARSLDGTHWVSTRLSPKMFSGIGSLGPICIGAGCPSDTSPERSLYLTPPAISSSPDGSAIVLWRNVSPYAYGRKSKICLRMLGCITSTLYGQFGLWSSTVPNYRQFGGTTRHSLVR